MMNGNRVYLVQTDTTVGFLSQSAQKLRDIKGRPDSKPFLKAIATWHELDRIGRVPPVHRRLVRKRRKTSFILPNGHSFRCVTGKHRLWVEKFGWCYTTSANRHGEGFDETYARRVCDVVVESKEGFKEGPPSPIWRLGRRRKERVR